MEEAKWQNVEHIKSNNLEARNTKHKRTPNFQGNYQFSSKKNKKINQQRNQSRYDEDSDSAKLLPHPGSYGADLRMLLSPDRLLELELFESAKKEVKMVKRKVALIIGYCGKGFNGMQINKDAVTVESELELALYMAGAVSKANFGNLNKINWSRSARTDRGVHAVANVVALKIEIPAAAAKSDVAEVEEVKSISEMEIDESNAKKVQSNQQDDEVHISEKRDFIDENNNQNNDSNKQSKISTSSEDKTNDDTVEFEKIRHAVNTNTSCGVQILKILKVTKSFNAKNACTSRRYCYMLPSFCFMPHAKQSSLFELTGSNTSLDSVENCEGTADGTQSNRWRDVDPLIKSKILDDLKTFSMSTDDLERLQSVLDRFRGTKKYHNYTIRKDSSDRSCKRFIKNFQVAETVICNGVEWVRLHIEGQSFMLHQIRKMVAVSVDVMRGVATLEDMDQTFGDNSMPLRIAPSTGLFLDKLFFESYEKRFGSSELSYFDFQPHSEFETRIDEMRRQIVSTIIESAETLDDFIGWLYLLFIYPKGYDK